MPEQIFPESIDAVLEADMRRLAQEVLKAKEHPETRNVSEQELLKKSIQEYNAPAKEKTLSQGSSSLLPATVQGASPEAKLEVEYLLDLALHKGIEEANSKAAASSPFVMDAFHDALVKLLYPELQKRGMVQ